MNNFNKEKLIESDREKFAVFLNSSILGETSPNYGGYPDKDILEITAKFSIHAISQLNNHALDIWLTSSQYLNDDEIKTLMKEHLIPKGLFGLLQPRPAVILENLKNYKYDTLSAIVNVLKEVSGYLLSILFIILGQLSYQQSDVTKQFGIQESPIDKTIRIYEELSNQENKSKKDPVGVDQLPDTTKPSP